MTLKDIVKIAEFPQVSILDDGFFSSGEDLQIRHYRIRKFDAAATPLYLFNHPRPKKANGKV